MNIIVYTPGRICPAATPCPTFSEHLCSRLMKRGRRRPYVQRRRAELAEGTRARILDAVISLHEEVGPSRTTVSAIARRAGVQRLTVYRHLPDERLLLEACASRWISEHPPPDPTLWIELEDPVDRTH